MVRQHDRIPRTEPESVARVDQETGELRALVDEYSEDAAARLGELGDGAIRVRGERLELSQTCGPS